MELYNSKKVAAIYTDGIPRGKDRFDLRVGRARTLFGAKKFLSKTEHFPEGYVMDEKRDLVLPVWFGIKPWYLEWKLSSDDRVGVLGYDPNADPKVISERLFDFINGSVKRENFAAILPMDRIARKTLREYQRQFNTFEESFFDEGRGIAILRDYQ